MKESNIMRECLLELSKLGRFFRNNVGVLETKNGTYVRYGLCNGSADIIGITPIVVTNNMVGKTLGIFTAIEVKTGTGRLSKEQIAFAKMIEDNGGIIGTARSSKESLGIIKLFIDLYK